MIQGSQLMVWRACRHALFVALFFGYHLLVQCEPQTLTKTIRNGPNSISRYTISVDGTDPSSMLKGLDLSGFERRPGWQSPGLEKTLSGLGLDTAKGFGRQNQGRPGSQNFQRLGKQGFGLNQQRPGSKFSDFGVDPFADLDDWRKQVEQKMGQIRRPIKPNQLGRIKSNGSGDEWNKPSKGQHGGQNAGAGGKWNKGGSRGKEDGRERGDSGNGSASGDFARECLDAHNEYRAKHGVPPLRLSSKLSRVSQEWADHLANEVGTMEHRQDSEYGENIFFMWSSDPEFAVSGRAAVDKWYSEIEQYPWGSTSGGSGTGHFSQVVWKGSTELGVGVAKSPDNKIFVVCNYSPAGNFVGRYSMNVPPVGGFFEADLGSKENDINGSNGLVGPNQMLGGNNM